MKALFILAMLAGLGLSHTPAAADAGALAAEAEALLAEGRGLEANAKMRAALLDLWSRQELTDRRAALVVEPAAGLGLFQVKAPAVYKPGEPMYLYFEPIGYSWTTTDAGEQIHFLVDVAVKLQGGKVIWEQAGFTELKVTSGEKMTEFFANLTFTFDGLPVGDYAVVTTLNDQASGEAVSEEMNFSIAE